MDINKHIKKHWKTKSDGQIGAEVGLSKDQVRHIRLKLGLQKGQNGSGDTPKVITPEVLEEEIKSDRVIRKLKETSSVSDKKNKALHNQIEELEAELNAALEIKSGIKTHEISIKKTTDASEATAFWLASDWHCGEKVTFGQTNGLNEYTPEIAAARADAFFRNGLRLTNMSAKEVSIKTIVLALLGDFITGHLHLDAVENNYLPPIFEVQHAQNLIVSGIEFILKNSKFDIIIPCHSGNHGRTTKFSHFGSENGHSLEYMMYHHIKSYFREEKRVTVMIAEGAHSYLDVYGYNVRFLHGHDVKFGGGVGGLTIPLNKAIAQWDKARPSYVTCLGHFHSRLDGGNFVANGSLIGYNSFALSIKASAEKPQQQFFLIDSKRGKTIVCPIFLD